MRCQTLAKVAGMLADILALAFGVDLASKPRQNLRKGEGITPSQNLSTGKRVACCPQSPHWQSSFWLSEPEIENVKKLKYVLDSYALVAYLQDETIADQDELPAIHHQDGGRPP